MSLKLFLFALIIILILPSISFAQSLHSNETEFEVLPIFIKGDGIYLSGNTTYLAAYVQAYYQNSSYKKIGMDCYLDGDEFTSTQNCSVIFYPEKGVCSILWPNYDDLKIQHEMKCKIYNPSALEEGINQSTYINRTFVPIEFSVWALKNYSSLVGEEFNLPIYIKNSGLFSDSYNVTIWVPSSSNNQIIIRTENFTTSEIHGDAFDPHAWQQTGPETKDYQIKMVVLNANSNPQVCVNVSSQQMLTQGGMIKGVCMEIKSNSKSMPELGLIQVLFIMLTSTIFILKFKKKI